MDTLSVRTGRREEFVDITGLLREAVSRAGWRDGLLCVYCPHTTGAVTINEGADPDVASDITASMARIVPERDGYRHAEGNSDAHIKSSLFGCGQLVIVEDGQLRLGAWQHVFFCEFDGPRTRQVWLKWLSA